MAYVLRSRLTRNERRKRAELDERSDRQKLQRADAINKAKSRLDELPSGNRSGALLSYEDGRNGVGAEHSGRDAPGEDRLLQLRARREALEVLKRGQAGVPGTADRGRGLGAGDGIGSDQMLMLRQQQETINEMKRKADALRREAAELKRGAGSMRNEPQLTTSKEVLEVDGEEWEIPGDDEDDRAAPVTYGGAKRAGHEAGRGGAHHQSRGEFRPPGPMHFPNSRPMAAMPFQMHQRPMVPIAHAPPLRPPPMQMPMQMPPPIRGNVQVPTGQRVDVPDGGAPKTVYGGASTVPKRPPAHLDKKVTAMVPASVRNRQRLQGQARAPLRTHDGRVGTKSHDSDDKAKLLDDFMTSFQ